MSTPNQSPTAENPYVDVRMHIADAGFLAFFMNCLRYQPEVRGSNESGASALRNMMLQLEEAVVGTADSVEGLLWFKESIDSIPKDVCKLVACITLVEAPTCECGGKMVWNEGRGKWVCPQSATKEVADA